MQNETKRHLKGRAGDHKSTSPLTGEKVNNNKFIVKNYCLLLGYVCSLDVFSVFNYELHKFNHLIKEFLHITKNKPLLNKQKKSQ